jgi:hypothetical protein
MSEEKQVEEKQIEETPEVDLKPKKPAKLAPQGLRVFTVCRLSDESGVSGTGVVIEGIEFATGQCVLHWLAPAPKGSIAIFDSVNDFISIHIKPHPTNETIITYEDGEQHRFKPDGTKEVKLPEEDQPEPSEEKQ